jgi:flagella basal body P-ring formation protein FlgA
MATSVGPILVKPGRMALLVIDGDGLRITQPVLPLRQGRFGERVKVSNPQSHRSWLARVSGEGMLHTSDTTGKEEGR